MTRPPAPEVELVGAIHAGADPRYVATLDFPAAGTLRWNADALDQTLELGANAWTLLKITAPLFHQRFHDLRQNKIAALMMIPQARAGANVLASPLPFIAAKYLETTAPENFAHPSLPDPAKAGVAPVFAAKVTWDDGWIVTDARFRTGPAMFLANMLALQSEAEADPFLPSDQLAQLR